MGPSGVVQNPRAAHPSRPSSTDPCKGGSLAGRTAFLSYITSAAGEIHPTVSGALIYLPPLPRSVVVPASGTSTLPPQTAGVRPGGRRATPSERSEPNGTTPAPVGSLDWEIYRALYRASPCPVWKAHAHPNLVHLAGAAGTTRNTVWRRFREWRRVGFLRGHEIIPHPALFGVGLVTYEVHLSDPKSRQQFLDELELVDGVFVANFALGPRTMVIGIADSPESQNRRAKLIGRIAGVDTVTPSRSVWLPPRPKRMSPKDWRLLAALRENPEQSFSDLARTIGITAKTLSRRYQLLQDTNGILTYRVEDFSRFPGTVATFSVLLSNGADSRAIAATVEKRIPGLLELVFIDRPPYASNDRLGYSTFVSSASSMESTEAAVYEIPGVSEVRTMFIGGERSYRGWFDERVRQIIHAGAG